jgi:hypothetical protein
MINNVEKLMEWEVAGKTKYREKTCPNATLFTINPTRVTLGLNPAPVAMSLHYLMLKYS